jgi:hypothetical protein
MHKAVGGPTSIAEASEAGSDGEMEAANVLKLFSVEEINSHLVAKGLAVKREMLNGALKNTKTVFVIQKWQQVVVFLQRRTSAYVKREAVAAGTTFFSFMGLPNGYPIRVVQEGGRDDLLDVIFG